MQKIEKEKSKIETIDKLFAKKKPVKKSVAMKSEDEKQIQAPETAGVESGRGKNAQRGPEVVAVRRRSPGKNSRRVADSKEKAVSAETDLKTGKKKSVIEIKAPVPGRPGGRTKIKEWEDADWVDKADPVAYKNMKIKHIKRKVIRNVAWACVVLAGVGSLYFYSRHMEVGIWRKSDTSQISGAGNDAGQVQDDLQMTKAAVEKLMELPVGEEPVLATVTDVDKIRTQKFFDKAQNGDRVLIYKDNQKLILYRPTINKIIEVSQTSGLEAKAPSADQTAQVTNDAAPAADEAVAAESPVRVAVYNGSTIKGLAKKIGGTVALLPGTAIVQTINAAENYTKTSVIDLSGSHSELAQKIAESLGGEIGTLPEGEKAPEADILVIGGSEYGSGQ
ncbi:MAG: LytR C-terminal domain-containing protein [Candidatus Moranbacteria bacterium]|nr:LytR C-terminal domain-containing protein [Candidatus Moranbacteria bacterium]